MAKEPLEMKAVLIKGTFTETEFKMLCDTIRLIERQHPNEFYEVVMLDPTETRPTADMQAMMQRIFPKLPENDTRGVVTPEELLELIRKGI